MEYETLSLADQLMLARDALRAKESDHFRISLTHEPQKESRLEAYEIEIEELKKKVKELEPEVLPDEELTPQQKAARTRKQNAEKDEDNG